jgi:hypothetical protein
MFVRLVAVLGLALFCAGCADKEADHFLDALRRQDYDAAFVDLHSELRATFPDAAALRARMTEANVEIVDFSRTCGSSGALSRSGYNVTTRAAPGKARVALVFGAPPERRKCNGPLLIEKKRDPTLPDSPWKVVTMRF